MNAESTTTQAQQDYLDHVRAALSDLPASEVEEIVADVAVQLSESDDPVELQRLGTPQDYATELRLAAGYPAQAPPARAPSPQRGRGGVWLLGVACVLAAVVGFFGTIPGSGGAGVLVALAGLVALPAGVGWFEARDRTGLRGLPEVVAARRATVRAVSAVPAAVVELVVSLRPAWWVLRAGLAAVLVLSVLRVSSAVAMTVVLGALLVAPSVWLSQRAQGDRGWSWVTIPLNLLAVGVLLAVPLGAGNLVFAAASQVSYAETDPVDQGLAVSNVYAFDADGRPLTDVYLYDQDGQPLQVWEYTCYDGVYQNRAGVNQEDPPNRFPLPRVEPDPVTGACEVVDGLPFSVAIPAGPAAGPTAPTSSAPSPSSGVGSAPSSTPPVTSSTAPDSIPTITPTTR